MLLRVSLMKEITYWNILFLYFTLLYPLLGKKGREEVGRFALLQVFLKSCERVQVGIKLRYHSSVQIRMISLPCSERDLNEVGP